MKKIWKFPLCKSPANIIGIYMPQESKILTVNIQYDYFTIWAEVETSLLTVTRKFIIYATGEPFLSEDYVKDAKYIGTIFQDSLVWHVYDLGEVG